MVSRTKRKPRPVGMQNFAYRKALQHPETAAAVQRLWDAATPPPAGIDIDEHERLLTKLGRIIYAACCPVPPLRTWPKKTSCTAPASTEALSSAARIACAPSCAAFNEPSEPDSEPIGVRTALIMQQSRSDMELWGCGGAAK